MLLRRIAGRREVRQIEDMRFAPQRQASLEQQPKPPALPTNPEAIMWNTLLYAAVVFALMSIVRFAM